MSCVLCGEPSKMTVDKDKTYERCDTEVSEDGGPKIRDPRNVYGIHRCFRSSLGILRGCLGILLRKKINKASSIPSNIQPNTYLERNAKPGKIPQHRAK